MARATPAPRELLLQPLLAEGWKRLRGDKEYVFPKAEDCFGIMMNTLLGYLSRHHKAGEVGLKAEGDAGRHHPTTPPILPLSRYPFRCRQEGLS
jgi:hypothetical protein